MKKFLERLAVFEFGLKIFSFFALRKINPAVKLFTNFSAWINLKLNRPVKAKNAEELAETWLELMPPDGRDKFKIDRVEKETAFVEIHLHCPLRGTGNAQACYELMNYDRKLMDKVGGNLVVLKSQSQGKRTHCELAIRKKGESLEDLIPAHLAK